MVGSALRRAERFARHAALAAALLLAASTSIAAEAQWTLDSALANWHAQSRSFDSATADIELTTDAGTRYGRVMVVPGKLRIEEFEGRTILVLKNEVWIYDPTQGVAERFRGDEFERRYERYAQLGFSESGRDLRSDYLITTLGEDIMGSRRILGFELTPIDDEERQNVVSIRVWIDLASWLPVRQEINTRRDGTWSIGYGGLTRNLPIDSNLFKPNWPKGVQVVKH